MDKELEEFKKLYGQNEQNLSSGFRLASTKANAAITILKKGQLKMLFTFMVTAAAIIYVDYVSSQKIETSKPAFYLLLGCAIYYAATKFFLFTKLSRIDPTLPVLKSIRQVESFKKLNQFFATYGEMLYAVVMSVAVYLYLQPILIHLDNGSPNKYLQFFKFIWPAFLAWAFYYTFFIKRRQLRKDTAMVENYLQQLRGEQ